MLIKTKDELANFLAKITREGLNDARTHLTELSPTMQFEADEDALAAAVDEETEEVEETENTEEVEETENTEEVEETEETTEEHVPDVIPELGEVNSTMIIKQLNNIRSGRSLKDKKIALEMSHYLKGLSDSERLTLWTFLNGLSQVLGGFSGEDATDPEAVEDEVVIKATAAVSTTTAPEDDNAPPIKVKVN